MTNKVHIQTLGIVGVGLIGGSLSLALKDRDYVGKVIGFGRSVDRLQGAQNLHVIDEYETSYDRISECDIVVVCVPVRSMEKVFSAIQPYVTTANVITDVGSTKGYVIECARAGLGQKFSQFVAGHPIAGTEKSGYEASFSTLYKDRRVILTPTDCANSQFVEAVRAMWSAAGADVVSMEVKEHDDVLAATSHLPHLLAYGLVDSLARLEQHDDIFRFAAGGFRDFTRIASSDVEMWRDISFTNKQALVDVLDSYLVDMQTLRAALLDDNEQYVTKVFENARNSRAEYLQRFEPNTNYKNC